MQAPHRVGGASCWPPLFILLVPFRFVLAPSGQPNNSSTSTHKGAEPSSAQVPHDSHSPTHPPTHTLTLSHTHPKHNHLRVHSLTHLLAHSLIHSFTLPVMHSLTHELITFALPHYASRGTQNDSKLATHVVGWHMSPVPSPILSSPASLARTNMQAVHSASGRLTTTDSQPSEAGINAIDSSQKPIQYHPDRKLLEGSILVLARRKEGH